MSVPEAAKTSVPIEGNIGYAKAHRPDLVVFWDKVDELWQKYPQIDPDDTKAVATLGGELNLAQAEALDDSAVARPRLAELTPEMVVAFFRLFPKLRHYAEQHDPLVSVADQQPPIERPADMPFEAFVNALSVAAIANWIPYRGTGGRLGIRVHPLNDPNLINLKRKRL